MRPCLAKKENEITDYEAIFGVGKALGMGGLLKGWETPKGLFRTDEEVFQRNARRHYRRHMGDAGGFQRSPVAVSGRERSLEDDERTPV